METLFTPAPNREAVALIAGRTPVASQVFYRLLPELRARAFTVSGLEGANALQRLRDALAALPQGIGPDGQSYTWDTQKKEITDELEPYLGEEGAKNHAQLLLRTNGFQAFSSTYTISPKPTTTPPTSNTSTATRPKTPPQATSPSTASSSPKTTPSGSPIPAPGAISVVSATPAP